MYVCRVEYQTASQLDFFSSNKTKTTARRAVCAVLCAGQCGQSADRTRQVERYHVSDCTSTSSFNRNSLFFLPCRVENRATRQATRQPGHLVSSVDLTGPSGIFLAWFFALSLLTCFVRLLLEMTGPSKMRRPGGPK